MLIDVPFCAHGTELLIVQSAQIQSLAETDGSNVYFMSKTHVANVSCVIGYV